MRDESDLQPELADVLQEEPAEDPAAIDVCVRDIHTPVRTQPLPPNGGMDAFTKTVGATGDPVRLLSADRWRGRAIIVSVAADFKVGFNSPSNPVVTWPQDVPLEVRGIADIYVQAVADTVELSVIVERWAAGGD